ncbi:MAG TPA: hypothetical protein VFW27_15830, partial [Actinoplanes sp.]|nr:hypothetical protein [Actinoplanes sp.]
MDPTSSPDNTRPPRGLSRFWPVHRDGEDPAAEAERGELPVALPGETEMVALGSRRGSDQAAGGVFPLDGPLDGPVGGPAGGSVEAGPIPPGGVVHGTPVPAFPGTPLTAAPFASAARGPAGGPGGGPDGTQPNGPVPKASAAHGPAGDPEGSPSNGPVPGGP